jgi:hypothetical protein
VNTTSQYWESDTITFPIPYFGDSSALSLEPLDVGLLSYRDNMFLLYVSVDTPAGIVPSMLYRDGLYCPCLVNPCLTRLDDNVPSAFFSNLANPCN